LINIVGIDVFKHLSLYLSFLNLNPSLGLGPKSLSRPE